MIKLIYDIDPVAKGRPRMTKQGRTYTPKRTKDFENDIYKMSRCQMRENNWKVLEGPLKVEIMFYLRRPKSAPARHRKYPHVRPDLDNYIKGVLDGASCLWNDDAQICTITASKYYAESGRIEMRVKPLK